MAKTLNFKTDDGKAYTLEFTRNTVIATEALGFSLAKIYDQPIGMMMLLWRGAFLVHHESLTTAEIEALFDVVKKDGIMDALIDLYRAPIASLVGDDEENPKNVVEWTIT